MLCPPHAGSGHETGLCTFVSPTTIPIVTPLRNSPLQIELHNIGTGSVGHANIILRIKVQVFDLRCLEQVVIAYSSGTLFRALEQIKYRMLLLNPFCLYASLKLCTSFSQLILHLPSHASVAYVKRDSRLFRSACSSK